MTDGSIVCCNLIDPETLKCLDGEYVSRSQDEPFSAKFFLDLGLCIFFILMGGCMSGLTLGLLSLDPVNLEILKKSGDKETKKYAEGIAPLVERHHLLLVTLLMANAAAMESLPIFLNHLVAPLFAIVISVTAVLIFGEIVPQAICSRFGLSIGYHLRYFVWVVIAIFFVIAYPLSLILDRLFGHNEGTFYRRAELKELVAIHGEDGHNENAAEALSPDEITIIKGALDLSKKTVRVAMTKIDKTILLSSEDHFDRKTLEEIVNSGHSRIPIFDEEKQKITSMVLVKRLIVIQPSDSVQVKLAPGRKELPEVPSDMPLYDILNIFQNGNSHMAVVADPNTGQTIGIITLEDVIEELIQEEIVDETDVFVDVEKRIRVARKTRSMVPQLMKLRRFNSLSLSSSGE
mmetsp:Transcript_38750/g.54016  ORF Transcript_38750/g.54016 Transcript_38750/m.54016 type:complete len:404 (-) Transcript_38750:66-1277(-)